MPFDPDLIVEGEFWFQEGLEAASRLLDLADPPTAIFASNDEMAMGVLAAAHIRNITVPEELAIAGFEDNYFTRNVWPALSSVRIPLAVGDVAGSLLASHANAAEPAGVKEQSWEYIGQLVAALYEGTSAFEILGA